jgi:antitoxin FitA
MKTITLKDIPTPLHAALKQRARRHGRSLNREALQCLEMAVAPNPVDTDELLRNFRTHRAGLPGRLNDRLIRLADEGRA